jgi:hypothetical protein
MQEKRKYELIEFKTGSQDEEDGDLEEPVRTGRDDVERAKWNKPKLFAVFLIIISVSVLVYYLVNLWFQIYSSSYNCKDAPACGIVLASFKGVNVFSNGIHQCTNDDCAGVGAHYSMRQYQCIEFVERFMDEVHGISPGRWSDVNANELCTHHPPELTVTTSPKAGDLYIDASFSPGHVAVITKVYQRTVDVIEQNASPTGKTTYLKSSSSCFLTASDAKSCSHRAGGVCGGALGRSYNTINYCQYGSPSVFYTFYCPFMCVSQSDFGIKNNRTDFCLNQGSCSELSAGSFCGNSIGAEINNTLVVCKDGLPASGVYCDNGCVSEGVGNDFCS